MKKVILFKSILWLLGATSAFGQFGEIRGKVIDKSTGQPLPGAHVSWKFNDSVSGVVTNEKGEYLIKPLTPGIYDLEFSYVMYSKQPFKSVLVSAEKSTYVDIALVSNTELPPIEIIWEPPMIDIGTTATMTTYSASEIEQSVEREVVNVVAQTPGVYQKEEGGSVNIRGAREGNTIYMVDGIKMIGDFSIPKSAIAEISVITGGIPAQFGDATGGVVIITTKSHNKR